MICEKCNADGAATWNLGEAPYRVVANLCPTCLRVDDPVADALTDEIGDARAAETVALLRLQRGSQPAEDYLRAAEKARLRVRRASKALRSHTLEWLGEVIAEDRGPVRKASTP